MPTFHASLVNLRNSLGYQYDSGACVIFSEKLIDAFLADSGYGAKKELAMFRRQMGFIETHYKDIPAYIKSARKKIIDTARQPARLTEEEQQALQVDALIQQGELYFYPDLYPEFFTAAVGRSLYPADVIAIAPFAASDALAKQGGRKQIASMSGFYNREALWQYMSALNKAALNHSVDFALSLACDDHRAALCYDAQNRCWELGDINQHRAAPIKVDDANAAVLLMNYLLKAFEFHPSASQTAFHTKLFVTGQNEQAGRELYHALQSNKNFAAAHALTAKRASHKTEQGLTLAFIAAQNCDVNELVRLAKVKNPDGTYAANLTEPYMGECTPANMGAITGHVKVIKFYQALRKRDQLIADLDKLNCESTKKYVHILKQNIYRDFENSYEQFLNSHQHDLAYADLLKIYQFDVSLCLPIFSLFQTRKFSHHDQQVFQNVSENAPETQKMTP